MRSKETILYAEDDLDDFDTLQEIFRDLGTNCDLIHAKNGLEVISLLESSNNDHYPALILLDGNMPQMDGRETLKQIKQTDLYAGIPVVLFSTTLQPQDLDLCSLYQCICRQKPACYQSLSDFAVELLRLASRRQIV